MATAVKRKLSGSTDGRNIKITATSSAGTTVHTAVAGTTAGTFDEIWLTAHNTDTVDRQIVIEFGGTTNPDDRIYQTIAAQSGEVWVIRGKILQNASVVKVYAAAANVITIGGFVNAITD